MNFTVKVNEVEQLFEFKDNKYVYNNKEFKTAKEVFENFLADQEVVYYKVDYDVQGFPSWSTEHKTCNYLCNYKKLKKSDKKKYWEGILVKEDVSSEVQNCLTGLRKNGFVKVNSLQFSNLYNELVAVAKDNKFSYMFNGYDLIVLKEIVK